MDLVFDFSFQKWTLQDQARVFLLSERSICVLHIGYLFIPVAQVMWSFRQIFRRQLANISKKRGKNMLNKTTTMSLFFFSLIFEFFLPVIGFEVTSVVPGDFFNGNEVFPGLRLLTPE